MSNVWAVTTRELRSYFLSPLAYLVGAFFVFGAGLLFWLILQSNHEASIRGLISNVHVLFLFVIPMISMRLLAEEQRTGTMELLMTNPVQEWEIVTGKFLGSAFFDIPNALQGGPFSTGSAVRRIDLQATFSF